MSFTCIDLFSGAGGSSEGAIQAGGIVAWAANHNPKSVRCHEDNHPNTHHVCQDLHQADWSLIPAHDIVLASPCCQGHSLAAGKQIITAKADLSRSTAWAVTSCLDVNNSKVGIIENVSEFQNWRLFEAWKYSLIQLGYSVSINLVNAATLGVPQSRMRVFFVLTKSRNPITLKLIEEDPISARSFIDLNPDGYKWDNVSDRVPATQNRVRNGREKFGPIFLDAAYGSEVGGRSIDKPLGTVTTVNKHSLVIGDRIRALTVNELAMAQTFPTHYRFPKEATAAKAMIGNAVPPTMARKIITAVLAAV
jgi:DNA (cytosine-5)-methyltransferase 1